MEGDAGFSGLKMKSSAITRRRDEDQEPQQRASGTGTSVEPSGAPGKQRSPSVRPGGLAILQSYKNCPIPLFPHFFSPLTPPP